MKTSFFVGTELPVPSDYYKSTILLVFMMLEGWILINLSFLLLEYFSIYHFIPIIYKIDDSNTN
ncbi:MAG TPA: hypothetical protein DCP90_03795 [Clostridiales bacterium]|nr:MAG: hypothetical protein A2Y22_05310 [Clostridiales bacterium GWD2_32_59]HAN09718.1 hypothetical protein [Clostridiales bacterium]